MGKTPSSATPSSRIQRLSSSLSSSLKNFGKILSSHRNIDEVKKSELHSFYQKPVDVLTSYSNDDSSTQSILRSHQGKTKSHIEKTKQPRLLFFEDTSNGVRSAQLSPLKNRSERAPRHGRGRVASTAGPRRDTDASKQPPSSSDGNDIKGMNPMHGTDASGRVASTAGPRRDPDASKQPPSSSDGNDVGDVNPMHGTDASGRGASSSRRKGQETMGKTIPFTTGLKSLVNDTATRMTKITRGEQGQKGGKKTFKKKKPKKINKKKSTSTITLKKKYRKSKYLTKKK